MNTPTQTKTNRLITTMLLLGLLFLAAWLPRAAELDAFVTPDERRWQQRSANFLYAIDQRDFISTYQAGHPGVTVMWAGSIGLLTTFPSYVKEVSRPLDEESFDAWMRDNSDVSLLQLLVASRRWLVLAISLLIAATYLPLSNLFGVTPAFVATLFVAWEPFHIGLSRQLHPDGLMATLILFAITTFAAWLYDRQRHLYLFFAAVATGLAVLTKSPALILPFVMLILTLAAWAGTRHTADRRVKLWQSALLFALYSALTFVLLWPVAWSLPHDAFMRMFNLALEFSQQGHELPLFFQGEVVDNPGPLFYPITYLMRATPATLFGLVCALIAFWRGWPPLRSPKARQSLVALLVFAVIYAGAITFAEKKLDRYLLPAMPALTVIAAVGWVSVAIVLKRALRKTFARAWEQSLTSGPRLDFSRVAEFATLGIALILLHASFSALNFPYYLTYYNPLLGGSRTAPKVMMIGWGEGLEKAAEWINQQPLTMRRVVAWYGDGPLSYYLDPTIEVLPFYAGGHATEEYWFNADYAVLYINQWQRQNPSRDLIDYFLARPPAYSVSFAGLDLVHVYALRDLPPPEFTHLHRVSKVVWDEKIELAGYYLRDTTIFPGEAIPLALFWRAVARMEQEYSLALTLRDSAGNDIWSSTRSPAGIETNDWPVGKLWRDAYTLELPAELAPGSYELVATYRAENGELLPLDRAASDEDDAAARQEWVITTLSVQQPTLFDNLDATWQGASVDSVAHAETATAGSPLFVDVTATLENDTPLKLSLRLLNTAGESVAQNDQEFQRAMRFRLPIPAEVSPGSYTLAAVLYDPNTLAALPDQHGEVSVVLSEVEVQ